MTGFWENVKKKRNFDTWSPLIPGIRFFSKFPPCHFFYLTDPVLKVHMLIAHAKNNFQRFCFFLCYEVLSDRGWPINPNILLTIKRLSFSKKKLFENNFFEIKFPTYFYYIAFTKNIIITKNAVLVLKKEHQRFT